MNVKVVIIVVFVAVLALLGAPLALGAMKNGKAGGLTAAQATAEWNPTNLVGTSWGAVNTESVPPIMGTGTVTVDMTVTFNAGGAFSMSPIVTFSPDTAQNVQEMVQKMLTQSSIGGKWSLAYPKLTLTMANEKGEEKSMEATISGNTITGPNLMKPNAPPLTLTRR